MDPQYIPQDVVRCTLCKWTMASMYCNVCHTHLCKDCVDKHFSDKSKVHNVVPLEQYLSTLSYPQCPNHPQKQCELQCKECDVPICSICISSGKHLAHKAVDIFDDLESKKEVLKTDLQELEKLILPKYEETTSHIQVQKADQRKCTQNVKTNLKKHGEALHKEIDSINQSLQKKIDDMDTKLQTALEKHEKAISNTIIEIKQVILHLKSLLHTSDVCLVSKYKSRNEEFRKLPPNLKITFPNFQPQKINREQFLKQFGFLSPLSIETEEQGYTLPSPGAESSPPDRPLLDVPVIITELATAYNELDNVSCLSDEEIWTRGSYDKILKLYTLKGELVKSVRTKSGNEPEDIAVTRSGDLVYIDYHDRSINVVSNTQTQRLIIVWIWRPQTQIQTLIKLQGWRPCGVCSTASGDLLVTMDSDDGEQTKVVRYSGSTEKQSIQWDNQGNPLYSPAGIKYVNENRNLDICVTDSCAHAVVVVSAAGKLRFRYTGHPRASKGQFDPRGITTDSHSKILTSDWSNHRIHVVNKNGHFLRYIDNCGLQWPWGLCVDSKDNLFVAGYRGEVKKIQYYK